MHGKRQLRGLACKPQLNSSSLQPKRNEEEKKAEKRRLLTAPSRHLHGFGIRQRASLDEEDEEEAMSSMAVDSLRQKGLAYSKGKPPPLASGDSMVVEEDEQNDVDSDSDRRQRR